MRDTAPPPVARHPGDLFLMLLCLFSGIMLAAAAAPPGALERVLPGWLTAAWALFLIIGAATVLTGVYWRNRVTGLLLELAGRVTLVIGGTIYATAFLAVSGGLTLPDVAPLLVFNGFMGWRAWQVHHMMRELREVLAIMTWAREHRDET